MQHDILKGTWVFQEVKQEGKQEGLQEGKQEGLQEGLQKGLQKGLEAQLIQFVEIRFPTLLPPAKQIVEQKKPVEQLETMLNTLYRANTIEEAMAALLAK